MKYINRILVALFIIVIIPSVYAINILTIDTKSYNETTRVFTVSGTASYHDVMVSLFDGDNLLSFKTVETNNNSYTATFNIRFEEDKTITIKVGDINSSNYEMTTLNVKQTVILEKSNVITNNDGNSITIIDLTKAFEYDDVLSIQIQGDLSGEDQNMVQAIENALGDKKVLIGAMFIRVQNSGEDVNLTDKNNGYKLFINLPESALEDVTSPHMARILDDELTLEEGKAINYNSDEEGFIAFLNNIGTYVLYDDLKDSYDFLDNSANQTYNPQTDNTLRIRIDALYSSFLNVYVDNTLVDESNYTKEEGSTIITFTKAFMSSLSSGSHTITVNFTGGSATTNVTIGSLVPANTTSNPQTNDSIGIWIIIFAVSLVGIIIGFTIFKKNNKR